MWLANTVIQGASAFSQVLKAGVGVYDAFDSYSKQKEIKLRDEARNELEIQIALDMKSGKTRMTLDENGQPSYTGLSPEAEVIRARYEARIDAEMGGMRWGNAGRAKEALNQMYSDLNASAAKMIVDKTYSDVQNEFQMNLQSGIDEYIKTGDDTLYKETIEQAKTWMSDEVWNQYEKNSQVRMQKGRAIQIAMSIAEEQGIDAAKTFLNEQTSFDPVTGTNKPLFSNEELLNGSSRIQQASTNASTAAATAASNTYTQTRDSGATYGNAYRAAIANLSDNPAVAARQKEVAQNLLRNDLMERFGHDIAGSDSMSLTQLQDLRNKYGNLRSDYQDQGTLYDQHIARIDRAIEQKQAGSGGSGSGTSANTNLELAYMYRDEWRAGSRNGLDAVSKIFDLDIPANKRTEIFREMLQGKDGEFTQAAQAYQRWEQFRAEGLARLGNRNTPEKRAYNDKTRDILKHLGQMRFTGNVTPENMLSYVEEIIQTEQTDLLNRAGGIRNLEQVRRMSLSGALDYMHSNQYDENMNRHSVWIGNSENLYNQLNAKETETVSNLLRVNDWRIVGDRGFFEEKEPGDRTGQVHFNIKNSHGATATVRVGEGGELEKKEGNRWVSFNNELSAGRNESIARFEASLSSGIRSQIETTMNNFISGRTNEDPYQLEINIRRALGNRATTDQGKAYIAAKMEEYRNGRR